MPRTKSGRWSLGLIIAMPGLLSLGASFTNILYKSVPAGRTISEDIIQRPALALAMLLGMAAGVSAFITGLMAIVKQKERALLACLATLLGALFTLFLIGEVLFPH